MEYRKYKHAADLEWVHGREVLALVCECGLSVCVECVGSVWSYGVWLLLVLMIMRCEHL